MENYIVSARKYRPMNFDSVVGQSALTTTLKNAVKSKKLAHAYLFCGPRGVGKTTCARIFAKAINCLHPTEDGEACNQCESCSSFNEQRSLSIFELDAASNNSVENIKSLMEQTRIPPQIGIYKVFIIDEVHMLSTAAFNAFLKTLEEPPAHVIFILATTEKHKILPTILSRCQIYDFERMTVKSIVEHLKMVAAKEQITYEDEALQVIAEKADGGMRDALSIFDQTASFCQGNITYQKVIEDLNVLDAEYYFNIVDYAYDNRAADILVLLNQIINKGFDGGLLVNGLASHLRSVLMAKDNATLPLLDVSQNQREKFKQQAQKCTTPFIYKALKLLNECDIHYKQSSNKRLLVEITLIQVAQITQPQDDEAGVGHSPKRLKSLFKKLIKTPSSTAQQVAGKVASIPHTASTPSPRPSTPQPVSQPEKPSAKSAVSISGLGITFDEYKNGPEKPRYVVEEPAVKVSEVEQKDFTNDDLLLEWRSMCARISDKGIATRLKLLEPKINDYPNIEIELNNDLILNQLNPIKGRIRATLVNALKNPKIQLSFKVVKQEETKGILTLRDLFDEMRNANPSIEKMRTLLDLELL